MLHGLFGAQLNYETNLMFFLVTMYFEMLEAVKI